MGCVRRRGKSWNAQVRISGWRNFTKSFAKKSDAIVWINDLEQKLRSANIPDSPIDKKILLKALLLKYAEKVSPNNTSSNIWITRVLATGQDHPV